MEEVQQFRFKLLVLGDWGVGKTSLVRSFVERKFAADYLPTIGVNILVKDLVLNVDGQNTKILISIWDIAGQKDFRPLVPTYHAGATGVFFVGDLSRLLSFDRLTAWYEDLSTKVHAAIPSILIANKCDLPHIVEDSYLNEVAAQVGAIHWFKTSAITGENIQEAFILIAQKMLENSQDALAQGIDG